MIEWKYTNGSCRAAYWSPTLALWVLSWLLSAGCRHVLGSVAELPMSSMYPRQVRPLARSWSATVLTALGYTQPTGPKTWPSAAGAPGATSL